MSTWFSPSRPSTTHNATATNNVSSYGLNYNSQPSQMSSLSAQVNKQQTSHAELNNKKHNSSVYSLTDNLNRTPSTYSKVLKSTNATESMFPNFLTAYMARPRFVDMLNKNKNASIFSDNTRTACDQEEHNFKRELVTSVEKPFTTLSKKLDRIESLLEQINVKANECQNYKSSSNADIDAKGQLCKVASKPNVTPHSTIENYSYEEAFSRATDIAKEQLKDILQDSIMADMVVKLQECFEKIVNEQYQKLYREIVSTKNVSLQEIITELTKNRHLLITSAKQLLEKLQSTNFQAASNVTATDLYSNNMEVTETNTNITR
ncbi:5855_t:CDS:2 [Paraglomus occultum]|uniref:5855_t:CDS:1 n=1 Tax=Paraglomus occultum TaxID=144539 RepID=A0A9N8VJS7_9GLOM|nr:5855_t:CDS:2 [Paraglomus occultum]